MMLQMKKFKKRIVKLKKLRLKQKDNIQRNSTRDQVNEAKTNGINKIEKYNTSNYCEI